MAIMPARTGSPNAAPQQNAIAPRTRTVDPVARPGLDAALTARRCHGIGQDAGLPHCALSSSMSRASTFPSATSSGPVKSASHDAEQVMDRFKKRWESGSRHPGHVDDTRYEYVERYHYLGYRVPFGAQLRYFIKALAGAGPILGCLQFSSPAWKVQARDRWIGWSGEQRERNLQRLIHQSRFLILPWIRVRNLASTVLGLCARVVPGDWECDYGYRAVLLETFVDWPRYQGTCYRAANWICLGKTTGRGRADRENKRGGGKRPKQIYVYPLTRGFREALLEG